MMVGGLFFSLDIQAELWAGQEKKADTSAESKGSKIFVLRGQPQECSHFILYRQGNVLSA